MSHFSAARIIKSFILVLFIFVLYALMHATIAIYVGGKIDWHPGWLFWGLGVASVCSFVIAHGRHNRISTNFYRGGMVWMGLVIIANLVLLPIWLLSLLGPKVPLWLFFAMIGAFAIGGFFFAVMPRVKTITLRIPALRTPVSIMQISDVHLGEIYSPEYLSRLVKMTNERHPDVIVLTGDLFDGGSTIYKGMVEPLKDFQAPVLFITGNHEVYEGVYTTTKLIEEQGVTVLDDQIKTLAGIQFVGLSYPLDYGDDKHRTIIELAKKVNRNKPMVLLRHEPKRLDDAVYLGADLMLAGHTHNGQLWPFNLVAKLFYEHVVGLHKKGDTNVYISCGAGTWGPPFRIGSRAEIVEFRLVPLPKK